MCEELSIFRGPYEPRKFFLILFPDFCLLPPWVSIMWSADLWPSGADLRLMIHWSLKAFSTLARLTDGRWLSPF